MQGSTQRVVSRGKIDLEFDSFARTFAIAGHEKSTRNPARSLGETMGVDTVRVRAVIFDLDDTLLSSSKIKWDHFKAVGSECYGLHFSDEKLRSLWGRPLLEQVQELFGTCDTPEGIYDNLKATEPRFLKTTLPGAIQATKALLDDGVLAGVITSAPGWYARADLERLGFPVDQFIFVHGEDDAPFHKPDPRVFDAGLATLQESGIDRSEVTYVGDLPLDFEAADAAGIAFVGVTTGVVAKADLEGAGVRVIVSNLASLGGVLQPRH